jgi:zinc transporter 2
VIISTLPVIRDAIPVLMESTTNTHDNDSSITGVPRNIDITQVENELQNLPDVIHTHSIHIWSLTVNKPVLQAHLAIRNDADSQMVLEEATQLMKDKYGFIHTNLQIEHYQQKMKECHICQRNSSEK